MRPRWSHCPRSTTGEATSLSTKNHGREPLLLEADERGQGVDERVGRGYAPAHVLQRYHGRPEPADAVGVGNANQPAISATDPQQGSRLLAVSSAEHLKGLQGAQQPG